MHILPTKSYPNHLLLWQRRKINRTENKAYVHTIANRVHMGIET